MPVNESLADEQWRRYVYCRDRGHRDFVVKADKCDQFFIGNQWEEADMNALKLQKRPAMTINKIISTVGTILGQQITNRVEVLFRPTAGAPPEVADTLSKVWMQVSQNNQLPWLRSEVFTDGVIRSRGFYDVRMDFSDSLFGELRITLQNSKNVVVDPDAEEYDPDSWNDVYVTKWLTSNDIEMLYNKEDADLLRDRSGVARYGSDALDRYRDSFAGDRQLAQYARSDINPPLESRRNIRVLDRQYRKLDNQLHFVDMVTGDMRPVPEGWDRDRIALVLEKMGNQLNVVKKRVKRVHWTVTADDIVLHDAWSPYKRFTIIPYFPHFRYGRTVGIVENLIGPQEILNKVSSQELHIVNTTANSGWVVEAGSLANMSAEELELTGATTGLVIEYNKGAQPPEKIAPNQTPTGLDRISMKAEEHIKTVSSVSDSMQGFDRADVAAKAIAYKQQQGSVGMAKPLDNLERTDWMLARASLDLIQTFYANERILNITHDNFTNEQEQVAVNQVDPVTGAITNDLTIGEYDIVITSSPYRASLEDSQFEQARALRELNIPIPDAVLIENSRLLRRGEIVKQMQAQANSPEAQQMAQLNMRGIAADVALKEANVAKTQANTGMLEAKTQVELEGDDVTPDMIRLREEIKLQRERMHEELKLKREEMEANIALKREELGLKMAEQRAARIAEQNKPLPASAAPARRPTNS